MHIPPYYKKESWQRFLAGTFIGAIIAFTIFVYMYGQYYERWVEENMALRSQLSELERNYKVLEDNNKELNQESQKQVTVDSIEVNINNEKELKLDSLIVIQFEEMIKEQINDVVGKDIITVSENYELLITAIENKTYKEDDFTYSAEVDQLIITPKKLLANVKLYISGS